MTTNDQNFISDDEVKAAHLKGQKLGLLIAALPVSDETKEALINLLPEFTPEQLDALLAALEAQLLYSATANIDKEFMETVEKIRSDQNKKEAAAKTKFLNGLEQIEKELEAAKPKD